MFVSIEIERLEDGNVGIAKGLFRFTVGTIFHRTHIPLKKWYFVVAMMMNAKKSLSSHQLARDMGMRQPTVWSMMQRVREAMQSNPDQKRLFRGIVEMDETYIGGKPRKENKKEDRDKGKRGRGTKKLPVVGIAEHKKGGKVAAEPFEDKPLTTKNFKEMLKEYVDVAKSILMTDQFASYRGMKNFIFHYAVDHEKQFVDGNIHTNTIESFWSLLKRAWYGQHHHYTKKHAHLYIGEACFKYNNRKNKDSFHDMLGLCLPA